MRFHVLLAQRGYLLRVVAFETRPAAALYATRQRERGYTAYVTHTPPVTSFPAALSNGAESQAQETSYGRSFAVGHEQAPARSLRRSRLEACEWMHRSGGDGLYSRPAPLFDPRRQEGTGVARTHGRTALTAA